MEPLELTFVVLGAPGAGKTSFLAALVHGADYARGPRRDVHWHGDSDTSTADYLSLAWEAIKNGAPVKPTDITTKPAELRLDLTRYVDRRKSRRATHRVHLKTVDVAGGIWTVARLRRDEIWETAIRGVINSADVLLVLVDATELDKSVEQRGQVELEFLKSVLRDAGARMDSMGEQPHKILAVVFSKCDTQARAMATNEVAQRFRNKLWPEETLQRIRAGFRDVGFFGVYLLGENWRWSRAGVCVRVGDSPIRPVGLFDAFEWVITHYQEPSTWRRNLRRALMVFSLVSGIAIATYVGISRRSAHTTSGGSGQGNAPAESSRVPVKVAPPPSMPPAAPAGPAIIPANPEDRTGLAPETSVVDSTATDDSTRRAEFPRHEPDPSPSSQPVERNVTGLPVQRPSGAAVPSSPPGLLDSDAVKIRVDYVIAQVHLENGRYVDAMQLLARGLRQLEGAREGKMSSPSLRDSVMQLLNRARSACRAESDVARERGQRPIVC